MGAAQSSNVSESVADIANFVQQSTTANASQTNANYNKVNFENCNIDIGNDITIEEKQTLAEQNYQIVKAKQNANLMNNIQQQALQSAMSKVGTLGIGYADAQNSATQIINSTSQIIDDMVTSASQYGYSNNQFDCENSTIKAENFNLDLSSTNQYLSSQVLNQQQTAQIVNDVSQSIQQKASATVEGIAGLLIAICLVIAVVFYSISKPLSSGSGKVAVGIGLIVLLAIIFTGMYLRGAPPFFGDQQTCVNGSNLGRGSDLSVNCTNQQDNSININNPPLRYVYPIFAEKQANLLQMAISAASTGNGVAGDNGGYRGDILDSLNNQIQNILSVPAGIAGVANIPNPLVYYVDPTVKQPQYYIIPPQYQMSTSGQGGVCTPGIIQVGDSNSPSFQNPSNASDCPSGDYGMVNSSSLQSVSSIPSDTSTIIANLNRDGWSDYFAITGAYPSIGTSDTTENRLLFARFALCTLLNQTSQSIDLNVYIDTNELVSYVGSDGTLITQVAGTQTSNPLVYQFSPLTTISQWDEGARLTSGGKLIGKVGVWDTKETKFQTFMRKIGGWIMIGIIVCVFMYMAYTEYKKKGSEEKK